MSNNYNDKSDFEVNKRLAELTTNEEWRWKYKTVFTMKLVKSECGGMESKKVPTDYCNNWADIGPLIEEYRIGVNPQRNAVLNEWWWLADAVCTNAKQGATPEAFSANPKRAAAICIILKLESENAEK